MKLKVLFSLLTLLLFWGCSDDNGTDPPKGDDPQYEIPDNYDFEGVEFTDQETYFAMLAEIKKEITDAIENESSVGKGPLMGMYNNQGTFFDDDNLNQSDLKLLTITEEPRQIFVEGFFADINNASTTRTAEYRKKGILVSGDGEKTYLVDSLGREYVQMIEKGIMGAAFYYQVAQILTSDDMIGSNVDSLTRIQNWDKAFGYFGAPVGFPANKEGLRYIAKYCNDRDDILGLNDRIMKEGYIKGRAAIENNDEKGLEEAITEIRDTWELVLVSTAIHYLNGAKQDFTDDAIKHHKLSEAWVFLWSVQFNPTSNGFFYEQAQAEIGVNLWATTIPQINKAIEILANAYNLNEVKDEL
jgi:hypothetical protein